MINNHRRRWPHGASCGDLLYPAINSKQSPAIHFRCINFCFCFAVLFNEMNVRNYFLRSHVSIIVNLIQLPFVFKLATGHCIFFELTRWFNFGFLPSMMFFGNSLRHANDRHSFIVLFLDLNDIIRCWLHQSKILPKLLGAAFLGRGYGY